MTLEQNSMLAPLTLTLMTDSTSEAFAGVAVGIERIGPDLERLGKDERQTGLGTRVSIHDAGIIDKLKGRHGASTLFARIDPINSQSSVQIDDLIDRGVTSLMLPYFTDAREVAQFVEFVDGRARATILCETAPALFRLNDILNVGGVDEVHFGLTDLMISTGVNSRYEILASDLFAAACGIVADANLPIHIAGVAAIGDNRLPISSDLTLARYAQLGATGSLLTRTFLNFSGTDDRFIEEISLLRERYRYWQCAGSEMHNESLREFRRVIATVKSSGGKLP